MREKRGLNPSFFQTSLLKVGTISMIVLQLALSPQLTWGDTSSTASPTPTTTNVSLSAFDAICKSVLANANSASSSSNPNVTQLLQYCQSAQSSMDAANTSAILWKVWAAVGGLCLGLCLSSMIGVGNQYVCMAADTGAGVADAAITKDFISALTAIASAGGGFAVNKFGRDAFGKKSKTNETPETKSNSATTSTTNNSTNTSSATNSNSTTNTTGQATGDNAANTGTAEGGPKPAGGANPVEGTSKTTAKGLLKKAVTEKYDISSCIIAATTAVQVYMDYHSMQESQKSAKESLDQAAALQGTDQASSNYSYSYSNPLSGTTTTTTTTNPQGSSGSSSTPSATASSSSSPCNSSTTNGNTQATLECAIASDSNLPPGVADPPFANNFTNATGTNLGDFLNNANSPSQAMGGAGGGGLTSDQDSQLMAALDNLGKHLSNEVPGAAYASSGGNITNTGDSNPDFNSMLSNMMDRLMPKKATPPKAKTGNAAVTFANQNRSPASIVQDRNISLFDRVTYRYYFVTQELFPKGGN